MAGNFPNIDSNTISHWPRPNLSDPTIRSWFPAYSITLTVVTTVIVVARLWSQKRKSTHGFGVDDTLATFALIIAIFLSSACTLGTLEFGFDRHIWDIPNNTLQNRAALIEWLSEGAFLLSTCLTKVSVLCFYRRLEPPCTRIVRHIIYAAIALTVSITLGCLLTQVLLCHPITSYWSLPDSTNPSRKTCESGELYYPIQGSLSAFSTFYTILIPVWILRNLPMSKFQRTGLRVVALLGLGVLGAGVARAYFLSHLVVSPNGDATWNNFNVFVCAQMECHLALICSSMPFLQRFFSHYPAVSIVFYSEDKEPTESVMSRVSSSLSGQIKRLPFGHNGGPRDPGNRRPRPQVMEIPEWEFETLRTPPPARTPPVVDEVTYERYVQGMFGPPAPPKDSRATFDQYRRQHGEIV